MSGTFFEIRSEISKVAEVAPRIPGAPDALWTGFATLAACPAGDLHFVDATLKGYPGVRARCAKKSPPFLTAQRHGGILIERELASSLLAEVPAEHASLRPVEVHDAAGLVSEAFALLEVHTFYPLDRDMPGFEAFSPDDPHGSHVASVGEPTWGEARWPRARIFRLLELPEAIFVDADLLAALDKRSKGAIGPLGGRRREGAILSPPPWARTMLAPFSPDRALATRSAEAFWALAGGAQEPELRALALGNPWYALAVAATLDRAPADDTREAASRASTCAARYAALVDRGSHPVTARSALSDGIAAAMYAGQVTARIDGEVAAAMLGSSAYDQASVERMRASLAPINAWLDAVR